jgi:hypothetical protein
MSKYNRISVYCYEVIAQYVLDLNNLSDWYYDSQYISIRRMCCLPYYAPGVIGDPGASSV